jgi:hypothetical protein
VRTYTAYKKEHNVYDDPSEVPEGLIIKPWRDGQTGDWVEADDGCIIQILRRKGDIMTTCTGTFRVEPSAKMDTERRNDIHKLGGENWYVSLMSREKPTYQEQFFAKLVQKKVPPVEAYLAAFSAKSRKYAHKRAVILLKTERIKKLLDEKLQNVFDKLDVDLEYLIGRAKDEAENSKNGSDRNTALKMLWDAYGVVEPRKSVQVVGAFQGFSNEEIEGAERPELTE